MKREKIVPIRLTEEEYERLIKMIGEEEKISVSEFIRDKIFSSSENEKRYKKILLTLSQMKTELHHAILVFNKTKTESEIMKEIERENEILFELKKELIKTHGGNSP